jgi:hypothetical protein
MRLEKLAKLTSTLVTIRAFSSRENNTLWGKWVWLLLSYKAKYFDCDLVVVLPPYPILKAASKRETSLLAGNRS